MKNNIQYFKMFLFQNPNKSLRILSLHSSVFTRWWKTLKPNQFLRNVFLTTTPCRQTNRIYVSSWKREAQEPHLTVSPPLFLFLVASSSEGVMASVRLVPSLPASMLMMLLGSGGSALGFLDAFLWLLVPPQLCPENPGLPRFFSQWPDSGWGRGWAGHCTLGSSRCCQLSVPCSVCGNHRNRKISGVDRSKKEGPADFVLPSPVPPESLVFPLSTLWDIPQTVPSASPLNYQRFLA